MELEVDGDAKEGFPRAGPETVGLDPSTKAPISRAIKRRLGRFTVLGLLGRGGMGTVLEAYDDTLARTVALKLLHGRLVKSRRERLLREAQALAQLSHPNVVQVYEVGLVEDQMFIAMELVEGENLRQWQKRRRPWRQVVETYIQAGRGLAAAHAEELVHRDFKPENCIIGDNGRVRVLDFGLARGAKTVDDSTQPRPSIEDSSLRTRLTKSGKVLGTLSYLPLQQLAGAPSDAKSDQFSFCVSLYEALYGVLPFCDASVATLMRAQRDGRLQPVPRRAVVPRSLRRILLRGLARDPGDRWASMDALLEALERVLRPRRRRLMAAVATLAVGFSAGAFVVVGMQDDPCDDPEAALGGAWSNSDRMAVTHAYLTSGHEEASDLLERVEKELDEYTRAWMAMYEESCQASVAGPPQPEPLFDRRMRCLRSHQEQLRVTIDALAAVSTPSEALNHTVLPFKLPVIESCADPDSFGPAIPMPAEPVLSELVHTLRGKIAQANTLGDAGELASAVDVARVAVEEARGVDYEPVLAEALVALGRMQSMGVSASDGEATLKEAILVAAQAKDDAIAARAWTFLIHAVTVQDEYDRAVALRFAATAAVDRSGDEVARGWLLNNLGILYGLRREYEPARSLLHRALAIKQSMLGTEHLDVGIAWFNLGNGLLGDNRLDEAREAFERARSIFMATVGHTHPHVAFVETGLGHMRRSEGRLAQAAVHFRRALEISERALGPEDLRVAKSLEYLGVVEAMDGQLEKAAGHLRRALKIYEQAMGPNTPQVGVCVVKLSNVERARGRRTEALALAERAMRLLNIDGIAVEKAEARFALARALDDRPHNVARARALIEQATDELEDKERAEAERWLAEHPAGGDPVEPAPGEPAPGDPAPGDPG